MTPDSPMLAVGFNVGVSESNFLIMFNNLLGDPLYLGTGDAKAATSK